MKASWDVLSDQPFLMDPEQDIGAFVSSLEHEQLQSREDYDWFLSSSYWGKVVAAVHQRAGQRCERCAATDHLQVHHLWYPPRGTEMKHLNALMLVCQTCHQELHQ
jgi:hypothetical protein